MRYLGLFVLSIGVSLLAAQTSQAKGAEKQLERAIVLLKKNPAAGRAQLTQLEKELSRAVKKQPKQAKGHFLLGRALFFLSRDDQALAAFERAIRLDPKRAPYHFMKGVILRYKRDRPGAIAALKQALALAPKNSRYWYELGDVHYNAGDNAEAQRCFERAIRLDKKNAKALFKAGVILAGQKKQAAALAYWRRAVKADPSYLSAHYNLGQAAQLAGQHREALKHFGAVVRLQPQDWRALSKLVQLHQALGQRRQRDAARAKIFALRKAGKNRGLLRAPSYCRDQFAVGKAHIFAYESFALVGPRAKRYAFRVKAPAGAYEISLGSYDQTTAIARETGSIKGKQRLFHLDGYYPGGRHRTFGMFKKEPSYEAVKKRVIAIVKGP